MKRRIEPEWLDSLPEENPSAIQSRADLRQLNWLMGHDRILSRAIQPPLAGDPLPSRPLRLVELGAGDGTLLLRVAHRCPPPFPGLHLTLVDRQNLLSPGTARGFSDLGWVVEGVKSDVLDWLAQPGVPADIMVANLFLHHFHATALKSLLGLASARTRRFIACEPRRSFISLAASRCLRWIGCNDVTRHDAAVSVRAGFSGQELSSLWPGDRGWLLAEQRAGLFSHSFIATRHG